MQLQKNGLSNRFTPVFGGTKVGGKFPGGKFPGGKFPMRASFIGEDLLGANFCGGKFPSIQKFQHFFIDTKIVNQFSFTICFLHLLKLFEIKL